MKTMPYISSNAGSLAIASVAAIVGGAGALLASAFWMASVLLPLGIGAIAGGWLLFERLMRRIARENGMNTGH